MEPRPLLFDGGAASSTRKVVDARALGVELQAVEVEADRSCRLESVHCGVAARTERHEVVELLLATDAGVGDVVELDSLGAGAERAVSGSARGAVGAADRLPRVRREEVRVAGEPEAL